jgi:hypothetical protein
VVRERSRSRIPATGYIFRLAVVSKKTVMTANRSASVYLANNIRIGNDRAIAEVVKRPVVDRNQHMLSAQKCDDRHYDDRDRQDIVPDALPANRAFEFGVMGLQILKRIASIWRSINPNCRDSAVPRSVGGRRFAVARPDSGVHARDTSGGCCASVHLTLRL